MTERIMDRDRVLEGTWEEIEGHATELAGQRVTLTVHADTLKAPSGNGSEEPQTLDRLLAGRVGNFGFEPTDLGRNHREHFGRVMDGKRREGRL